MHALSIHPSDLEVAADDADELLKDLGAHGLDDVDHLGPLHLGVMAVLADVGPLPGPKGYRSSRDIGPIVRALADLETLKLTVEVDKKSGAVALLEDNKQRLTAALERLWRRRSNAAFERLSAKSDGASANRPAPARTWLRRLLILIANRGLRVNASGELHGADLRVLSTTTELPPRAFLDRCARLGTALGAVFPVADRLLIGEDLDVLDLDDLDFARQAHGAWLDGRFFDGYWLVTVMAGLFEKRAEAIRAAAGSMRHLPYPAAALVGSTPWDPVSNFIQGRKVEADEMALSLAAAHRTHRAGLLALVSQLPPGDHRLDDVAELVHAHMAIEGLRRPLRTRSGQGISASLTHALPFSGKRVREHLPKLLKIVAGPLGLATCPDDETLSVTPAASAMTVRDDAMPSDDTFDLPRATPAAQTNGSKRDAARPSTIVQPNGEIMAPSEASIHGLLHIAQGADLRRLDQMVVFEASPRSLLRVADAGMELSTWESGLAALCSIPVPHTVSEMIAATAAREGELQLAAAGAVIVARDPLRLDEAMSHKAFRDTVLMRPAPTVAVLKSGDALEETLERLADRGFSVQVVSAPSMPDE